jgi:long-chain fatty acid transport protein
MRYIKNNRQLSFCGGAASALLAAALFSADAYAAGFAVKQQSASSMGTAFAADGVGKNDISTIFSNPAIMSFFEGTQATASATFTFPVLDFKNGTSSTAAGTPYANQSALRTEVSDVMDNKVMPALYVSTAVSENLRFGLSLNSPWASSTDYPSNWVGRYYATETSLTAINLGLLTSYRLGDKVAIGGGLQLQYAEGVLAQAVDLGSVLYMRQTQTPGATPDPSLVGARDAEAEFTGKNTAPGLVLGFTYSPIEELDIGFSYRSDIKHKIEGDMKFAADTPAAQAVLQTLATASPRFKSASASIDLMTPSIYVLGISYHDPRNFNLYFNTTLTTWSTMEKLTIEYGEDQRTTTPLNWKDSMYAALGGEYILGSNHILRAGFATEEEKIPAEYVSPRSPGSNRTVYAIGYGYRSADRFFVDLGVNQYMYETAKLNLKASTHEDNRARGNVSGEYERSITLVMLGVGRQW